MYAVRLMHGRFFVEHHASLTSHLQYDICVAMMMVASDGLAVTTHKLSREATPMCVMTAAIKIKRSYCRVNNAQTSS
jgi:hypothetical protein